MIENFISKNITIQCHVKYATRIIVRLYTILFNLDILRHIYNYIIDIKARHHIYETRISATVPHHTMYSGEVKYCY